MNYQTAKETFETAKDKSTGKPLENNTRLIRTIRGYGVKLHNTVVVEFLPNGAFVLNTGGWKTMTTKDRINGYSPCKVYSNKGLWLLYPSMVPFVDGMRINADGSIPAKYTKKAEQKAKKETALRNKIKEYAKGFGAWVTTDEAKANTGIGDCLFCRMQGYSATDHLLTHIKEKYYMKSMLYNALKDQGYGDPVCMLRLIFAQKDKRLASSTIRKYLQKKLITHAL
jgi:hypothetical protein